VIGALGAVGALGSLVGAIAAGFLGEVVPVVALLIVQGSGYVIGGVTIWLMTRGERAPSGSVGLPVAEPE
jgi:hypothetical protein